MDQYKKEFLKYRKEFLVPNNLYQRARQTDPVDLIAAWHLKTQLSRIAKVHHAL